MKGCEPQYVDPLPHQRLLQLFWAAVEVLQLGKPVANFHTQLGVHLTTNIHRGHTARKAARIMGSTWAPH